MKRKFYISALLVVLVVGFFAYLAIFYPAITLLYGKLTPFVFAMIILLMLPPFGGRCLGEGKRTVFQWYIRVFLSQLIMGVMGITMLLTVFSAGPHFLNTDIAFQDLARKVGEYSVWPWPGFPFAHIVVWSVSLAYYAYVKGRVPFHHNHALSLYQGRLALFGKTYVEMLVQIPTQIALSLAFASAIVSIVLGLDWLLGWPLYTKVPAVIGLVMLLIMPLFASSSAKKLLNTLIRNQWDLSRLTFVLMILLVPLLVGLGFISDKLMDSRYFITPIQTGSWLKFLPETVNQDRLMFLYWGWWLTWMPLLGTYYAAISRGRQIRVVIIGVLILPILSVTLLRFYGAEIYQWQVWMDMRGELTLVLGIIAAIILLIVTYRRRDTSLFARGFMPAADLMVSGRASLKHGTKIFGLSRFAASFMVGILASIFLLCAGGWYFIGILLAIFSPCLMARTCGISLGLVKQLLRDRKSHHE